MRKAKNGKLINNDQWDKLIKGAEYFMLRECDLAGRNVYGSDWGQCIEQIA